jgi:hypothetical protein
MLTHMQLSQENIKTVAAWAGAIEVEEIDPFNDTQRYPALNVQCGDTVKRAGLGDYVIRNSDGTFNVLGPRAYLAHTKEDNH